VVIGVYSLRLTLNFIIGFHDLSYVDWRYKMLKEKSGKAFQLVNLFGICMFPTLVVFFASIPLFIYAYIDTGYGPLDIIGSIIILLGTLLELVADSQMKTFIKNRASKEEVINVGLWNFSRHPNYLGEITIWFGVAFILIIARPAYWYYLIGAVINLLMFIFISIPMEEKHMLEYKPTIEEYIKTTSCLIPWKKRK
jgi:steroid 5-alpha reductase family enzyme